MFILFAQVSFSVQGFSLISLLFPRLRKAFLPLPIRRSLRGNACGPCDTPLGHAKSSSDLRGTCRMLPARQDLAGAKPFSQPSCRFEAVEAYLQTKTVQSMTEALAVPVPTHVEKARPKSMSDEPLWAVRKVEEEQDVGLKLGGAAWRGLAMKAARHTSMISYYHIYHIPYICIYI